MQDGSKTQIVEERPWGIYKILVDKPTHKVKTITVDPNKRLSLQSHKFRHEYWTIVDGSGIFTLGYDLESCEDTLVKAGDTMEIPPECIHRIQAGDAGLTFIEVQLGASFGEEDIIRHEDDHGRVTDE
jgi:mannose-6-phosphate isomerase-like protein (cupin superfamily)